MADILWNETAPADTDNAGGGDDDIRSLKTSMRHGLATEHVWPAATGAAGVHLLGSGRPYYGVQSAVSSVGTDGRLMLTSDTSRLFAVGSGGTVLLGDTNLLSVGTDAGIARPQRAYWAMEFGRVLVQSAGIAVPIPNSGFSGVPFVTASLVSTAATAPARVFVTIRALSADSFNIFTEDTTGTGQVAVVDWISIGTRTL